MMINWYPISIFGWIVTVIHTGLSIVITYGLAVLNSSAINIDFYYNTIYMYIVLFLILLYARHKKIKIFESETKN